MDAIVIPQPMPVDMALEQKRRAHVLINCLRDQGILCDVSSAQITLNVHRMVVESIEIRATTAPRQHKL
ncbi:MAG: hypothetical protein ABFD89_23795 [Bryobacteraceae bacterium]